MKLLLLGATGNLGGHVLEKSLARGHQVNALLRTPDKLALTHPELQITQGDARVTADLAAAVSDCDAFVNTVGGDGDIRPVVAANLIQVMRSANITRLINLGGAGILKLGPWMLYRLPVFPRAMVPVTLEHLKVYGTLKASDLEWTMVCPPFMTPGAGSGAYSVKAERPFVSAAKEVPLAAVAEFILDELAQPRFVRQRVGIRGK